MSVFATPKEVVAFRARDGQVPFEKWLDDLDDKRAVARVLARLARVRLGNLGDCRSIGEGVNELRVDYGPGYRVYFGQTGARWSCCSAAVTNGRKTETSGWQNSFGRNTKRANDENRELQKDSARKTRRP